MAGTRPGRPVKGVRAGVLTKVPPADRAVYEERARRHGLPLGDYLAIVLARTHDLADPYYLGYCPPPEDLPLDLGRVAGLGEWRSVPRRAPQLPKGDRVAIFARVPARDKPVHEQHARAHGLSLSEYVALVLARTHGLDDPPYVMQLDPRDQMPSLRAEEQLAVPEREPARRGKGARLARSA